MATTAVSGYGAVGKVDRNRHRVAQGQGHCYTLGLRLSVSITLNPARRDLYHAHMLSPVFDKVTDEN
jgi:hypothetical protein